MKVNPLADSTAPASRITAGEHEVESAEPKRPITGGE
jgi:hypothetical protein